jgi:hypothetical protein
MSTSWAWPTDFCGYQRSDDLVCRDSTDNARCSTHQQARYAVCSGCAGDAVRACSRPLAGGGKCDAALCPGCAHVGEADHKPIDQIKVTGTGDPGAQAMFAHIQKDLSGVIARILAEDAAAGELSFAEQDGPNKTAGRVLQGLALHLLVLNLSAMARGTQQ